MQGLFLWPRRILLPASSPGQAPLFLPTLTDGACRSGAQQAAEGRAFGVARRGACGGVPQAVSHGGELADGLVQLVGLGGQHLPVDARPAVGGRHHRDLVQRQAGGTAEPARPCRRGAAAGGRTDATRGDRHGARRFRALRGRCGSPVHRCLLAPDRPSLMSPRIARHPPSESAWDWTAARRKPCATMEDPGPRRTRVDQAYWSAASGASRWACDATATRAWANCPAFAVVSPARLMRPAGVP